MSSTIMSAAGSTASAGLEASFVFPSPTSSTVTQTSVVTASAATDVLGATHTVAVDVTAVETAPVTDAVLATFGAATAQS